MTVQVDSQNRDYLGLSSDTKPTTGIEAGIQFYETDTGTVYIFTGVAWVAKTAGSGGGSAQVSVTPTLTVHATYITGDYIGTSAVAMVFAGMARLPGQGGVIFSAILLDKALQSIACELWLFDTAITPPADSAAWSISDADAAHCVAVIPFSTYYASALNSVSPVNGINKGYKCAVGDTQLYGCLVTRGAPSYASGDLIATLNALLD